METGGYLQLENFVGEEYYPEFQKVNLARTAMLWIMKKRGYTKMILPYYLCDSMYLACKEHGYEYSFYHLNGYLEPEIAQAPAADECVLIVDYYGQVTDNAIADYKKKYGNIICDYTHSFFRRPVKGVDTIYSCRKFIGVSDGAYISSDLVFDDDMPVDVSAHRMAHILGRYEESAGRHYKEMLDVAESFKKADIRLMSKLTYNLLKAVDYEKIMKQRIANYKVLTELLPSENVFTSRIPDVPFAYPFRCDDGINVRKKLAEKSVFVPVNWKYLLDTMSRGTNEYDWSADILPLPVDQRYTEKDMERMARIISEVICGGASC